MKNDSTGAAVAQILPHQRVGIVFQMIEHADGAVDLGQVAVGDGLRGLVADADLETSGAPVDELDGGLGLEVRDGDSAIDSRELKRLLKEVMDDGERALVVGHGDEEVVAGMVARELLVPVRAVGRLQVERGDAVGDLVLVDRCDVGEVCLHGRTDDELGGHVPHSRRAGPCAGTRVARATSGGVDG